MRTLYLLRHAKSDFRSPAFEGDVTYIDGEVVGREGGAVNAKLATGDIEVIAGQIELYNRAETPPFAIEDGVELLRVQVARAG